MTTYFAPYIDGLVQERRNSIANALELRLTVSCTNPSMYIYIHHQISIQDVLLSTKILFLSYNFWNNISN